jgi:hypothetical protein
VEPVVPKPSKRLLEAFPCRFLSRMESRQTADTLGVRSHNRRRGTAPCSRQWDYDTLPSADVGPLGSRARRDAVSRCPRPSKPLNKALICSLVELFGLGRPNQWAPMWVTRQNSATSPVIRTNHVIIGNVSVVVVPVSALF